MKLCTILCNHVEDLAVLASDQSIEKHCHLKMASLEISNQIANYPYIVAIARKIRKLNDLDGNEIFSFNLHHYIYYHKI